MLRPLQHMRCGPPVAAVGSHKPLGSLRQASHGCKLLTSNEESRDAQTTRVRLGGEVNRGGDGSAEVDVEPSVSPP